MRTTDTWVCVADGARAQFYRCDGPARALEPVLGYGVPADGRAFVGRVASQLDRAARDSLFQHLVLVGPQPVLEELESSLSPGTRLLLVGELDKNLCGATPHQLTSHLSELLPH